jgi:hypothetical protein
MIVLVEQATRRPSRREEHHLTERGNPCIRLRRPSDDVVNLAKHQIRLGRAVIHLDRELHRHFAFGITQHLAHHGAEVELVRGAIVPRQRDLPGGTGADDMLGHTALAFLPIEGYGLSYMPPERQTGRAYRPPGEGTTSVKRKRVCVNGALPNAKTFVGLTPKTSPVRPVPSRNAPL